MQKSPEIRFKNYTSEWQSICLNNLGNTFTGLSGKTKDDFGHGNGQFITYINVFTNSIADIKGTEKVGIDLNQNEVKYGDVLFTTSSETPHEVGMSSVWLGNQPNTYLNSFCFGFRPLSNQYPYFLAYALRSKSIRKQLIFLAQGISRYNISKTKAMEIALHYPGLEEQKKIGNYLKTLELLVTSEEKKLTQTQNLKKAMLEKMFPKEGSKRPEIRLKGFNGDWEVEAIGNVLQEVFRPVDLDNETKYRLVTVKRRNGGIAERVIFKGKDILVKSQFEVKAGDYVISKRQVVHGATGLVPHELDGSVVSNEYLVGQGTDKLNIEFFALLSTLPEMYKKFFLSSYGVDIEKLFFDVNDWKKREILLPCLAEQIQISKFFKQLNETLVLQQQQLQTLKNLKQAFLGKMFV